MQENETTTLLRKLIETDSANPPGNEETIARAVADYQSRYHIDSRLIPLGPGRASLYAALPGESPGLIGLSGHLDTVQASDEWTRPPTTPTVKRGRVYGLGAADMKGGLAMMLAAFCSAARTIKSGRRPQRGLALLLSAGEETQFLGARDLYAAGLTENIMVGYPLCFSSQATLPALTSPTSTLIWPR